MGTGREPMGQGTSSMCSLYDSGKDPSDPGKERFELVREQFKFIFDKVDVDNNDSLDKDEWKGIFAKLKTATGSNSAFGNSEQSLDELFIHIDSNHDGSISFSEAVNGFRTMPDEETGKPKDIEATLAAQSEDTFNMALGFLTRLAEAFVNDDFSAFPAVSHDVPDAAPAE